MQRRIGYFSFDSVPAPKGASTHIEAFVRALASGFGELDLVTVAEASSETTTARWPGVLHHELPATGKSLIDRVLCFRQFLSRWLEKRQFEAVHFRSIFEGLPLLRLRGRSRLIFEVNGLPSIELKYRYPGVVDDRELMRKLVDQERACLEAADLLITPSEVTRQFLISARNVTAAKVRTIPNGVDLRLFHPQPDERTNGALRLLYFGTLAAWQGVELGIRALAQVTDHVDASLTILGTGGGRQRDALSALAAKLGIAGRVAVLPPVTQAELAEHLRASDAVLVPLTMNDRNLVQGCCPLKILEGMASGVPVIATGIPAVRELGEDGEHFLLVRPNSVDHIAESILRLWEDRPLAHRIGQNARRRVEAHYSWERAGDALIACYEELGISPLTMA